MNWFELNKKYSLNTDIDLNLLPWIEYSDVLKNPKFGGYYGYGLNHKNQSLTPHLDALDIEGYLGVDENKIDIRDNKQRLEIIREDIPSYFKEILESFNVPIGKARFAKLKHGTFIKPHIDAHCKEICRLHWPFRSDSENKFNFYNEKIKKIDSFVPEMGSVYSINPNTIHSFSNKSRDVDRIHLIINVLMDITELYEFLKENTLWKLET